MKKTLIALAALAATGAFAQSTVTMYGRADVGYANSVTKSTSGTTATETNNNGITSHNSVSSFWGIKGSEDLGGGMKANFIFEADLFPATGNTGFSGSAGGNASNGSFDRTSLLGVSGGFGSIMMGKDYTPTFKLIGASDLFGLTRASVVGLAAGIPTAAYGLSTTIGSSTMGSTVARQVIYTTPSFGGFTGALAISNNNTSTTATTTTAGDNTGRSTNLTGTYANGPLFVGLGWGRNEATVSPTVVAPAPIATTSAKAELTALTASYNFGVAKLVGGYTTTKYTPNINAAPSYTATETNLGVAVPMGNVTLLAQVGRNTLTSDGVAAASATDANGNDWVIGADYNLSKRTALFVKTGVVNKFSGTVGGADYSTKLTETNLGVKHTF